MKASRPQRFNRIVPIGALLFLLAVILIPLRATANWGAGGDPAVYLPVVSYRSDCADVNPPNPILTYVGSEPINTTYTKYKLSVTNWSAFPPEMFVLRSDLPPCGANPNSSRTWLTIWEDGGAGIYGFCTMTDPSDLTQLWFSWPTSDPAPDVYITMNDRWCEQTYTSNVVLIP